MKISKEVREFLSEIGTKGGKATKGITSPRKAKTSAANGRKHKGDKLRKKSTGDPAKDARREYMRDYKAKQRREKAFREAEIAARKS